MVDARRENNSQTVNVVPVDNTQNVPVQPVSTNTRVSGTNDKTKYYSDLAKHYAELAEDYADNADASADNALVSAISADNSAGICTGVLENEHFQTVYTDLESENSNIEAVGNNIENVNDVANDLTNIDTVKDNLTAINTNATNIVDIQNASANAQITITKAGEALQSANNAHSSEVNAGVSEDNAEIWAEGTDEEVQALGGVHSSKGWAEVSSQGQIQTDWLQDDNTKKDYIKNKPTNLGDFTDNLGSNPVHTHSQYITQHQDISGKLNKSGDTMTGTLKFNKSVDPVLRTQLNHTVSVNNPPVSKTFVRTESIYDNEDKIIYSERLRLDTDNSVTRYFTVTNYDAQGEPHYAGVGLHCDTDGSAGFSFPMCKTKPTTTSSATSNKVAVVTQNYVSGNSWYRVWSDGFIEQGGFNTSAKNGLTSYQITLLKPFTSTNYNIQLTARHKTENGSTLVVWGEENAVAKTVNNFHIWGNRYGDPGAAGVYWRACGY